MEPFDILRAGVGNGALMTDRGRWAQGRASVGRSFVALRTGSRRSARDGGGVEGWKAEMSGPSIYMPYSFRILSVALGMPFCTRCQEPSWKTS